VSEGPGRARRLAGGRGARRLVDTDGLVWCAQQGRDVDVDACLACGRLRTVSRAGDRIVEIGCAVTEPVPVPLSPWELPFGPWR
jgi:hypothetical protein